MGCYTGLDHKVSGTNRRIQGMTQSVGLPAGLDQNVSGTNRGALAKQSRQGKTP